MVDTPTVKCPNCARVMTQLGDKGRKDGVIPFECRFCNVTYFSEDHVPISGEPVNKLNESAG